MLKTGEVQEPEANTTEEESSAEEYDFDDFIANYSGAGDIEQPEGSDEGLTLQVPVLPVFKFRLMKNGKVDFLEFPQEMEKETAGLLKSFIKMFSPLLDTELYESDEAVNKVKKVFRKVGNSTEEEPSLEYAESTNYSYETSAEGDTVLENEATVESSGDTHNSVENSAEQSQFSPTGELEEASVDSNTDFSSPEEEPSNTSQNYNFGLSFSSEQSSKMKLVESFIVEGDNV